MKNELYDVNLPSYNEANALRQLLVSIVRAAATDIELKESNEQYDGGQIIITIGGIQTAFYLGGPQIDGLYAFAQQIADENFYSVDTANCTVKQ